MLEEVKELGGSLFFYLFEVGLLEMSNWLEQPEEGAQKAMNKQKARRQRRRSKASYLLLLRQSLHIWRKS